LKKELSVRKNLRYGYLILTPNRFKRKKKFKSRAQHETARKEIKIKENLGFSFFSRRFAVGFLT